MHKKNGIISAQDIVRKFNLPYHTVNYYTAIGLLPVVRKQGNQRIYSEKEVKRRLTKIFALVKEGYPLNLIRKRITGV